MTPYAALLARIKADPASPLLTYRDLGSGERMELSAASLGNAIAKTAGLLRDELDAQPGDVVGVHLPLHWQRIVWLGACAATGTVFAPSSPPEECDICVFDRAHAHLAGRATEDVIVSLAPFGLPETGGAPAGVTEAAVAMRAHPDIFVPHTLPAETLTLVRTEDGEMSQSEVMHAAGQALTHRGIAAGQRFAIFEPDPLADIVALAGALMAESGAVLVTGSSSEGVDRILAEEGVPPTA